MIKKRLGAAVLVRDGIVVQSIGFSKYLPVGKPPVALEFLNKWGVDEILLLDISATENNRSVDPVMVQEASAKCFVPLTVGGGISDVGQVDHLLRAGADRVVLNNIMFKDISVAGDIAQKYGDQCVVACLDVIKNENGSYGIYDHLNKVSYSDDPVATAVKFQNAGVGELMIQCVDRDGRKTGFDEEISNMICSAVHIPVLILGGAGKPSHFRDIFNNTPVSGAYAGNYFHFTEHSVITTKAFINETEEIVRLDTHADYKDAGINAYNRLGKRSDDYLEHLLYLKIEKEVI